MHLMVKQLKRIKGIDLAAELGTTSATISYIMRGRRRATVAQAEQLEKFMIKNGVSLTRWDFLYDIPITDPPVSVEEYLTRKLKNLEGLDK